MFHARTHRRMCTHMRPSIPITPNPVLMSRQEKRAWVMHGRAKARPSPSSEGIACVLVYGFENSKPKPLRGSTLEGAGMRAPCLVSRSVMMGTGWFYG